MPSPTPSRWPTRGAWIAVFLVASLCAVPYLVTRLAAAPAGQTYVPVGFVPKDFLAYVALIHEPGSPWLLSNPFTTGPQDGRFIQLFHQALRGLYRATGLSGFALLELSRPLLLAGFLLALWGLLRRILPTDRERTLAAWLVLLAGGFDVHASALAERLPGELAIATRFELWSMRGFCFFEAAYNPLWILGLTVQLLLVRLLLDPEAPPSPPRALGGGALLVALWFTHQYSALAAVAALAAVPLARLALERRADLRELGRLGLTLALALLCIGGIVLWQLGDPALAAASGATFGTQTFSPLWLPVTLGAVGVFAALGLARPGPPWRPVLAGWIAATVLLAALPLLHGYHFVPYLWTPVALAAAAPLAAALDRLRAAPHGTAQALGLGLLLFTAPPLVTRESVRSALTHHTDTAFLDLCRELARRPPGHVLAPAFQGNLVPALSPHRVYVGQWFLTPGFEAKSRAVERLYSGDDPAGLRSLVDAQRIRYLVAPAAAAPALAQALGPGAAQRADFGAWTLLDLGARE